MASLAPRLTLTRIIGLGKLEDVAVAGEKKVAIVLADAQRQRLETLAVLERELTLTRALITAEREAAMASVSAITEASIASIEEPLLRIVDHVLLRLLAVAVAAAIALPFLVRLGQRRTAA